MVFFKHFTLPVNLAAETPGVIFFFFLVGYCIKIISFPRVPISPPESGISAPLVIYSGCLSHGRPVEVGLYISHTSMKSTEVMVQNEALIGAERVS